jgi:hypothetical protein
MYQLLTGRLPFWPAKSYQEVRALQGFEILAGVRHNEVAYPREAWAHISCGARDLVARMLDR